MDKTPEGCLGTANLKSPLSHVVERDPDSAQVMALLQCLFLFFSSLALKTDLVASVSGPELVRASGRCETAAFEHLSDWLPLSTTEIAVTS